MTWTRSKVSEAEWYFREDPVANAHHAEWHRIGSGPRWGEYFYYMHGQMLARYEAERLSLGMDLTSSFMPELWAHRVNDSYDPRLGPRWGIRRPGTVEYSVMHSYREVLELWIDYTADYSEGIDHGINTFGEIVEEDIHNLGHGLISRLSDEAGVMGSGEAAMRDPIFYRWHGYIRSVFDTYKG